MYGTGYVYVVYIKLYFFKVKQYMIGYKTRLACLASILTACSIGNLAAQNDDRSKTIIADSLLKKANDEASELINVGYQSIDKKNISGAVSTIATGNIKDLVAEAIDKRLQGQAAGLQVVNSSGSPASGALISIRGAASINGWAQPLYIIDGIPAKADRFQPSLTRNVDNNPLADLNPLDISSITVLKDAQATALYGMRGGNGVIVINTYGGTSGKTYLDFTAYSGFMQAPEKMNVLDADAYRNFTLQKERLSGASEEQIANGIGKYLLVSTPEDQVERYNNNTSWQDQTYRTGTTNNFHLNLRGGDAVAKYSLIVGYTTVNGVVKGNDFSRFSTRFNFDYKVGAKLSFLNTLAYAQTNRSMFDEGNAYNTNPLFLSTVKIPTLASFAQDNTGMDTRDIDSADYTGRPNPYAVMNRMINTAGSNRILAKLIGQYQFSRYLQLRVGMFADYYRLNETRFSPSAGFAPDRYIIRSSSEGNGIELMSMNENTLNYNRTFQNGKHAIHAVVGNAIQSTRRDLKSLTTVNSVSDEFISIETNDNLRMDTVSSSNPTWRLISFFGSGNYVYNNKYVVSASLRADGSSRFAKGHQWGYFPSVAAAWKINRENFLSSVKWINELKLRGSYGITGNQEVGFYNSFNALVSSPYSNYSAIRLGMLGNQQFTWEQTRQANVGVDAEFAKGRVGFAIDVYNRETDNLFNIINLPGSSGFKQYVVSEGAVRNRGAEVSLYGQIVKTKTFNWLTAINITHNKNSITELPKLMTNEKQIDDYSTMYKVGGALGDFYGYEALGIYANTADVNLKNGTDNVNPFQGGDIIFRDVNKDGIIDEKDRTVIGNSSPDIFGGFNNTFTYKNVSLNIFLDYAYGNEIYNAHRAALESMSNYDNQSTSVLNYWQKEGDVTDMPRPLQGDAVGNTRFSTRWIEDGSYVRIKNLSLAYDLPLKAIFKNVFKSARVMVSAQNVYTFTDYTGYGTDVGSVVNPLTFGVDYGNLPQLRTFLIGIKLGL